MNEINNNSIELYFIVLLLLCTSIPYQLVLFSFLFFCFLKVCIETNTHTEENLLKHNLGVLEKVVLCAKYTAEICKFVKV